MKKLFHACLMSVCAALTCGNACALEFSLPLKCVMGKECFVQNYVDMQSGDGYTDYKCNHLSYNAHDGTDLRARTLKHMQEGISVLAAADGTVKAIRDGEPDINMEENPNYDAKKGCGNAVVLSHAEDYQTIYCHMKRGSVIVKKGQQVKRGDTLGQIGLSGQTVFPHLHFEVMKGEASLDPFTGKTLETGCLKTGETGTPLWTGDTLKNLEYDPTAFLDMGILDKAPESKLAREGAYKETTLSRKADAMIVWVDIMGPFKDDEILTEIIYPDGTTRELTRTLEKNQALFFSYSGIKRKEAEWPLGIYTARVTLKRADGYKLTKLKTFTVL